MARRVRRRRGAAAARARVGSRSVAPRVLIVSWEYPPMVEGGLGRHVRKLSEGLVREGVDVHVLTRGAREHAGEEVRNGVVVHRVAEPPFPKDDLARFVRWV